MKTWGAEVLTFAALNAEFDNILNNALSLVSPWTANMAAGGFRLTGLHLGTVGDPSLQFTGDTNTGIFSSGADTLDLVTAGSSWLRLSSVGHLTLLGTTGAARLHNLTTTQRDALTAAAGMLCYNTTTGAFNLYTSSWGAFAVFPASLTADVTGILPTANGGTGIAFFTAAGPTVARVYTFPDAATTVLTTNAAVTVGQGGTAATTAQAAIDTLSAVAGATNEHVLTKDTATGNAIFKAGGGGGTGGLQHIWVDAAAMGPRITNGPSRGYTEQTTNKNNHESLDFDTTTQEFAQFKWRMPKSWNESTITFIPVWTAASGSGTVVWALQAIATSNDDPLDVAFGTEQTSTDTLLLANDEHEGPASSAMTVGGTPVEGDLVTFQIKRNVADDTLAVDAKLLGIVMTVTTNADTDA